MEPKVLADALVEAGILHFDGNDIDGGKWYGLGLFRQQAETMITDWRVAGKVLESMWVDVCHNSPEFLEFVNDRINGKSIHELPRAIIEAWYQATEQGESE